MKSSEGKEGVWCEETAEANAFDIFDGEFRLTHVCGNGEDHSGSHKCMWCGQEWDTEVPC